MGDMADFALEHAANDDEHYLKYQHAPRHIQYEEGLIDEHGATIGNPGSFGECPKQSRKRQINFAKNTNPGGPGTCPKCDSDTHIVRLKNEHFFYGCNDYPNCNGSRNGK